MWRGAKTSNEDSRTNVAFVRIRAENIAKVLYNFAKDEVSNIYSVKEGDSLSKIAKENTTTVEKIKKDNLLKSDVIQIGQQLKL